MSYIMQLDTDMFVDLIGKALEKETEEKLWDKWLVELPSMNQENFINFEEYKKKHFKPDTSTNKTDEEILKDAENILKMMNEPA